MRLDIDSGYRNRHDMEAVYLPETQIETDPMIGIGDSDNISSANESGELDGYSLQVFVAGESAVTVPGEQYQQVLVTSTTGASVLSTDASSVNGKSYDKN